MKSGPEYIETYQRTKGSLEEKEKKNSSMSKKFLFLGVARMTGCSFK